MFQEKIDQIENNFKSNLNEIIDHYKDDVKSICHRKKEIYKIYKERLENASEFTNEVKTNEFDFEQYQRFSG